MGSLLPSPTSPTDDPVRGESPQQHSGAPPAEPLSPVQPTPAELAAVGVAWAQRLDGLRSSPSAVAAALPGSLSPRDAEPSPGEQPPPAHAPPRARQASPPAGRRRSEEHLGAYGSRRQSGVRARRGVLPACDAACGEEDEGGPSVSELGLRPISPRLALDGQPLQSQPQSGAGGAEAEQQRAGPDCAEPQPPRAAGGAGCGCGAAGEGAREVAGGGAVGSAVAPASLLVLWVVTVRPCAPRELRRPCPFCSFALLPFALLPCPFCCAGAARPSRPRARCPALVCVWWSLLT